MAFKARTQQRSEAMKPEQLKGFTGFLVGLRFIKIKGREKKPAQLFIFEDKKSGDNVEVWGCAAISQALTIDGVGKKLDPACTHRLCRLTYKGKRKIKGRSQPMKDVLVEVDTDSKKPGRDYALKSAK